MTHNPYSNAADAYGKTSSSAPTDQRGLEGELLLKAARKLQMLQDLLTAGKARREDISDTLDYNRRLWTIFVSNATDENHDLPLDLRNNIANLGVFVFKRTVEIMAEPAAAKIDALVEINRNIAAGLLARPKTAENPGSASQKAL